MNGAAQPQPSDDIAARILAAAEEIRLKMAEIGLTYELEPPAVEVAALNAVTAYDAVNIENAKRAGVVQPQRIHLANMMVKIARSYAQAGHSVQRKADG